MVTPVLQPPDRIPADLVAFWNCQLPWFSKELVIGIIAREEDIRPTVIVYITDDHAPPLKK